MIVRLITPNVLANVMDRNNSLGANSNNSVVLLTLVDRKLLLEAEQ